MKKIILSESDKKKIISEKEKAIIENFAKTFNKIKRIDETRLDYFDDLPNGKPSTLDIDKDDLKQWLCIYEENGDFQLYRKEQYISKDYEGEYVDTENHYIISININSSIDDVKKVLRLIQETAIKLKFNGFIFESVNCDKFEEFKTFEELTNAFSDCFFSQKK